MLVTAAPYTIKGAAFDCLRDAIFREERVQRERVKRLEKEGASPLLASDARVLPT